MGTFVSLALSRRVAPAVALLAAALFVPAARAAVSLTPLPTDFTDAVAGEADGSVRVIAQTTVAHPALRETRVGLDLIASTATLLAPSGRVAWVNGDPLPGGGAVMAYEEKRLPHTLVRVVSRTAGVNAAPVTVSDGTHAAHLSTVTASRSGAAAVEFWQAVEGRRRQPLRVATRGAGAAAPFAAHVDLPLAAYSVVRYDDAGDGVILETANGSKGVRAVVVRRIGRDGSIGPEIAIDASHQLGALAEAAVAPDGTIGVVWSYFSSPARKDGPAAWFTTLAPGATQPAAPTAIAGVGRQQVSNVAVGWAGERWVIGVGVASSTSGTLRIAEAPRTGPATVVRSYGNGPEMDGSPVGIALLTSEEGAADVVWSVPSYRAKGGKAQLVQAHRGADGAWADTRVLVAHRGGADLRAAARRPTGGLALVDEWYSGVGTPHDKLHIELVRTDD